MASPLVRGTILLSLSGLIARGLGFLQTLVVIRLGGPEAVGLYRMVAPTFWTLLIVTTAGVPYAVARLVAEFDARRRPAAVGRTVRAGLGWVGPAGAAAFLGLALGGPLLGARLWADPRASGVLATLAPAILVMSVSAVVRAFLQGLRRMGSLALAQGVEQAVNTGFVLYRIMTAGPGQCPEELARTLALGVLLGETAGLVVAAGALRARRGGLPDEHPGPWAFRFMAALEDGDIPRRMARLAAPVAAGRVLASLALSLNVLLIPARLRVAGHPVEQATALFGQLSGVALPVAFLPNLFWLALGANLVPSVARLVAAGRQEAVRRQAGRAISAAVVLGIPMSLGLVLLAAPLSARLFGVAEAARLTALVSAGACLIFLRTTSAAILHGLGRPNVPVWTALAALFADSLLVWHLAARPELGIRGAALASLVNFGVGATLNVLAICRLTGLRADLRAWLVQPVQVTAAALVAAAGGARLAAAAGTSATWSLGLAGAVFLAGYALGLRLTGLHEKLGLGSGRAG